MSESRSGHHGHAAASAGLAAAIAMSISCVVWMFTAREPALALTWGLWTAAVAFGATYAGVFFGRLAKRGRG